MKGFVWWIFVVVGGSILLVLITQWGSLGSSGLFIPTRSSLPAASHQFWIFHTGIHRKFCLSLTGSHHFPPLVYLKHSRLQLTTSTTQSPALLWFPLWFFHRIAWMDQNNSGLILNYNNSSCVFQHAIHIDLMNALSAVTDRTTNTQ